MRVRPFIVTLLIWAALAVLRIWAGWDFVTTGRTADPDSVMRLIEVRDWLGGQGWFDLHQYRIGPTGGVAMHWTRLADLIPAGIAASFAPVVGSALAERAAMVATPLVLLLALVHLTLSVVRQLARRPAPFVTAAVLASSIGMLGLFTPGDIDHHNLQLVLVLLLLRASVGDRTRSAAIVAATATVLSMIVGIETAPVVLAILGALALLWIRNPTGERQFIGAFGVALMLAALIALLLFMPRPWPGEYCDAWTLPVFWLATAAGAGFAAAWAVSRRSALIRVALPVALVTLIVIVVVSAFPACRVHPAGTDPLVWHYWIEGVSENQSLRSLAREQGWGALLIFIGSAPLVLLVAVWTAWGGRRADWFVVLAAAGAALLVTLLHVRGHAMLAGLTACLAAGLLARVAAVGGVGRIAAWLAFLPLPWLVLGAASARPQPAGPGLAQTACRSPELMRALNRLPSSTLIVPMMAEPHILVATRHRTLAATYHRNTTGNHAMIAAMIARPNEARAVVVANGVGYIVYCPGYDTDRYARENPASLAAALVGTRPPDWLTPVARSRTGVAIYRVDGGR